jgi:hypothetical protein
MARWTTQSSSSLALLSRVLAVALGIVLMTSTQLMNAAFYLQPTSRCTITQASSGDFTVCTESPVGRATLVRLDDPAQQAADKGDAQCERHDYGVRFGVEIASDEPVQIVAEAIQPYVKAS